MAVGISTAKERWMLYALAIVIVAAVLRLYNIGWSFSNNGIDEGIMLQRSVLVAEGYSLYGQVPCDQAPLAFLVGSLFEGQVVPLRSLVAGLSVLAVLACMSAAWRCRGGTAMLVTGALLAVDFAFVRESRLFSLDALAAIFIAFALLAVVFHAKGGRIQWLVLSGLLLGLSAAVKLHGGVALIGLALFVVTEGRRNGEALRATTGRALALLLPAALPLAALMALLGPGEMLEGMVFEQGHREFDTFLKLSVIAFFGLNMAYLLPLAYAKKLWGGSPAMRALLLVAIVLLAYMVLQPLMFLHHMVLLSPPLAILAGVLVSSVYEDKKVLSETTRTGTGDKKAGARRIAATAFLVANLAVSGSLVAFGLALQDEPYQSELGELLMSITQEGDWVISGDPIIASYADRMIPPEMVNVAYRRYPDLTLEDVESAILAYDVSVVVVCYRLNDLEGLTDFLESSGYEEIPMSIPGKEDRAVLDLFQEGIGPVSFYVRTV